MTDKEAIRLIHEAGFAKFFVSEYLAEFKRLIEMTTKIEREECAETVENLNYGMRFQPSKQECATAIRARKLQ